MTNTASSLSNNHNDWNVLYRVGGIAAIAITALIPIQGAVFVIWPPPTTVLNWFALFQKNWVVGLLDMDLLLMIDYILTLIVFLSLWVALKSANRSLATIALLLQCVSITIYFASTAAFEMLD